MDFEGAMIDCLNLRSFLQAFLVENFEEALREMNQYDEINVSEPDDFFDEDDDKRNMFLKKVEKIMSHLGLSFELFPGTEESYFNDEEDVAKLSGTSRTYYIRAQSSNEEVAQINNIDIGTLIQSVNYPMLKDQFYRMRAREIVADQDLIRALVCVVQRMV
ncbi:hypothetical protein ACFL16_00495 [Patescibacteria group bacterium]